MCICHFVGNLLKSLTPFEFLENALVSLLTVGFSRIGQFIGHFVNFKENFKLLKSGQNSTGCPQKRRPTFDLMQVENDCIYTICFHIFLLLILQLKILYKAIQNRLKVCYRKLKFEDLLMTDDPTFSKNALTYSSHITLSNFTDISLATA